MSKNIVTSNCELDLGIFTAESKVITCNKSSKADNKDIYYGTMTVTLTKVTDAAGLICPSMLVTISPSAQKTKVKNIAVLLEGDNGSSTGIFVNEESGLTAEEDVTVTIKSAGQSKVKGV